MVLLTLGALSIIVVAEILAISVKNLTDSIYSPYNVIGGRKIYKHTRIGDVAIAALLSKVLIYAFRVTVIVTVMYLLYYFTDSGGVGLATVMFVGKEADRKKKINHLQITVEKKGQGLHIQRNWVPKRQFVVRKWGIETVIFTTNVEGIFDTITNGRPNLTAFHELVGKNVVYGYIKEGKVTLFFSDKGRSRHFMSDINSVGLEYNAKSLGVLFKRTKRILAPHAGMMFGEFDVKFSKYVGSIVEGMGFISVSMAKEVARGTKYYNRMIPGAILKGTGVKYKKSLKGHFLVVPDWFFGPDLIVFETKTDVTAETTDDEFFGFIGLATSSNAIRTDGQSIINFKLHDFFKKYASAYLKEILKNLFNEEWVKEQLNIYGAILEEEDRLENHRLLKALSSYKGWIFKIPYFCRSVYNLFVMQYADIAHNRVVMPEDVARSGYAFPDPTGFSKEGDYVGEGVLGPNEVFLSGDISNKDIALYRRPSAEGEFVVVQHKVKEELIAFEGNALFFSTHKESTERILAITGGADFDDLYAVIINDIMVAHFKTLKQIEPSERKMMVASEITYVKTHEFTVRNFIKEAKLQLGAQSSLGLIINTMMADSEMGTNKFWGVDQESAIDDIIKYGKNIMDAPIMDLVWNFWKDVDGIYEHLIEDYRMPRLLERKIDGVVYRLKLTAEVNKDFKNNLKDGLITEYYVSVTRKMYEITPSYAAGVPSDHERVIPGSVPITVLRGGADQNRVDLNAIMGDIELKKIKSQRADNVPWEVSAEANVSPRIRTAWYDIQQIWWGGTIRDEEHTKDETKEQLALRLNIAALDVANELEKYTREERIHIAFKTYAYNYNKDVKIELADKIEHGLGNYSDGLVWSKDVIIKGPDGDIVKRGMNYYTMLAFSMVDGTYLYKQIEITDHSMKIDQTVNVTVSGKDVKHNGAKVGEGSLMSGSYEMTVKGNKGFIQMPVRGKRGQTPSMLAEKTVVIVAGWYGRIKDGKAELSDMEAWKDMYIGKTVELIDKSVGSNELGTYIPHFKVTYGKDHIGHIANDTALRINGATRVKITEAGAYTLIAKLM